MATLSKKTPPSASKQKNEEQTKASIKKAINSKTEGKVAASAIFEDGKAYTLNVEQASIYDKNTRVVKNKKYDEIYASIKANGFNQGALDVTQRPDEDPLKVIIEAGGNTSFSILKKLYEETGNKKHYEFIAIYHNWKSESNCIIKHLKENIKGTPYFIDTAIGVNQFRIEKQAELGTPLADIDLLSAMVEEGYETVNRATLSHINFVIETMWPICPELLKTGISARKVIDIIKLEKEGAALHAEIYTELKPADWKRKFIQALEVQESRCISGEEYEYKQLYYSVIDTLENDQVKRNRINNLLDQRINNKKGQAYDPELLDDTEQPIIGLPGNKAAGSNPPEDKKPPSSSSTKNTISETIVIGDDEDLSSGTTSDDSVSQNDDDSGLNSNDLIAAKTGTIHTTDNQVINSPSAHQIDHGEWTPENKDHDSSLFSDIPISCSDSKDVAPLPTAVNELRQIMFKKAELFQKYLRIPVTIVPIDSGTGFVLNKYPEAQLLQACINLNEHDNPRTKLYHKNYIGWWLLLGFTDMLQLNHLRQFDIINKYQVEGNLKVVLLQKMASYSSIMELDLINGIEHSTSADVAPLFLSDATPKELQLFIELQLTYNKLMRLTNADIWSTTGRGIAL